MASSSQQPSSSSTSIRKHKFEAFLSFRGEDTRYNFTDHLFVYLRDNGINTFRDDQLERGEEITSELLKTIEESRISIAVFSKNYAHSKWCLDELAKIMECRKEKQQIVLPVFYHVDPSDVRKQTGSFGEAFSIHERNVDEKKMQRWRVSLTAASNLSGYHVKNDGYESEIIEEIADDIHRKLDHKILDVGQHIVGMDAHLEELKSLINIGENDICMVGIYGLGGIGKTTIAKYICNKISDQFERISFLENIREKSKATSGLLQLQEQLLDNVLKAKEKIKLSNIPEGINVIKNRVCSKKVLIVLDDVDCSDQLNALAGNCDWFGLGSRIIITTRDKHLLPIQLFSWNAFKTNRPIESYASLSEHAVGCVKGLPLALKVLGSFLFSKTKAEWESALEKLKRKPNMEVQNVLRISFDGLDETEQELFLDIACFFKGQPKDFATRILYGCNFHPKVGMRVLSDKCLITLRGRFIGMHDLLQEMGWEIVRQTSPKEPGKWSRLWDPEDIYRVLTRNTGTETIEGIILDLDMPKPKQIEFTTEAFKMMKKLRLLKVHQDAKYDGIHWKAVTAPKVHFSGDFEFPSYELRYFQWDGYPLESLPSNFHGEELVELKFRSSNIKQLFQENKLLEKLKVINLSDSQHLIEIIPNISNAPNLEILILNRCQNLESLPSDICKLKYLTNLCCSQCTKLKIFPEIKEDMKRLRELHLDFTSIQELPSSVKRLKGLEYLNLFGCYSLLSLPDSICNLRSLKTLNISSCWNLEKLPLSGLCSLRELNVRHSNLRQGAILSGICCLYSLQRLNLRRCNLVEGEILTEICHLSMLKVLDLSGNHFSSLPAGISQLSELRVFRLRHCKMLQEIPELPSSLRDIDAHDCACLKTLSSSASLPWKRQLWCSLFNCFKSEVQDLECGRRWSGAKFDYRFYDGYDGKGINIFMPGSCGIPEWIKHQKMGSEVTIELPMNWHEDKNLLGFVLCSLYVPAKDELKEVKASYHLYCQLIINGDHFESLFFISFCHCYESDASDQVWLLYYPKIGIPARYRSNQWRNLEVIFHNINEDKPVKVEKSGVHLIYDQGEGSGAADTNVNMKRSLEDVETTQLRTHTIKD
ncbi:hypothetical protein AAG906_035746 [Vitis piasezkii]